jgi:2-polyprenyl-3-methyl-5-hydroxy-6-metoxy-1,4-benzoquinol methylase
MVDVQQQWLSEEIETRMRDYYTDLYKRQLGHRDWETRVQSRVTEEQMVEPRVENFEFWCNISLRDGLKVLIVGAGTGGEFVVLTQRGCDVYAIEPDSNAVAIAQLKARAIGTDPIRIKQDVGENLPFEDNHFDLVWCWTVLEHVRDVEATISEMIRVTRLGGRVFINTPEYRQFYEGHYKLSLPMFAPKWFVRLLLRFKGRPIDFFNTIQFVNATQLTNIFQRHPVIAFFVVQPWHESLLKNPTSTQKRIMWLAKTFSFQRDQNWILLKLTKA